MTSSQVEENDDTKEITIPSTSHENIETDEEQIGCPPWSYLPALAVENIYSFLNRRDQKNMSLACRNWHNEFSSPRLWRKVTYHFFDPENNTEMRSYACRYGTMFHHVEVVFKSVPPLSHPLETYLRQLKCFLKAVAQHSHLLSISFKDDICCHANLHRTISAELFPPILNLIKSQRELRFVEISGCRYDYAEATKIITSLLENNINTLKYLHLPDFVRQQSPVNFADITVDDDLNFRTFMNLEILSIDYTPMFENMMLSFYELTNSVDMTEKTGCLKKIKLIYHGFDSVDYMGIHTDVWKYFLKIFPGLSVDLNIYCECDTEGLFTFIVPHMPLTVLNYCFGWFWLKPDTVDTLLHHFTSCEINMNLEVLKIRMVDCPSNYSNISTSLISFTNACPELKTLELVTVHPAAGLDTVFNSWLENRPMSLNFVKITVELADTAEKKLIYSNLIDVYAPLLQPLGISLSIVMSHYYNHWHEVYH